jgi:vitamin B12 transporter
VIPGLRYDDISTTDSFWSPSLGITYLLAKNMLLRTTVARGFSIPSLASTSGGSEINKYRSNPDLSVEKMWSYQLGFESGILDTFWLKVSAYRHDVDDSVVDQQLDDEWWTRVNAGRQRRQGLDLELRTKPIHNVTLAGSACFLEVQDLETGEDVPNVPTAVYDVSLKYDDLKTFRALAQGRYLSWDASPGSNVDLSGFIVDLNLIKKLLSRPGVSLEVFLSVHNLLNEDQFVADIYPNPERWVGGGIRASF